MRTREAGAVDAARPHEVARMPRLSAQQRLDEERGIMPRSVVAGAVRMCTGGPDWLVNQMTEVIMRTLDKLGFEIVAKVARRD